jgi:hypothetical protein
VFLAPEISSLVPKRGDKTLPPNPNQYAHTRDKDKNRQKDRQTKQEREQQSFLYALSELI